MKVTVITADKKSKEFILNQQTVIVGRSKSCHICIPSNHISRQHLEITSRDDCIFIKDLTLSNWVSYNEEKLVKNNETQYFDFAPLILPGNLSLKIETGSSPEINESIVNSPAEATGESISRPENSDVVTEKIDIYNNPIASSAEYDKERIKKENKGGANKEMTLMIVAFLLICSYIAYNLMSEEVAVRDNSTQIRKPRRVKRIVPKRINKAATKSKAGTAANQNAVKSNPEKEFDKLIKESKCMGSFTSALCRSIFKNKTKLEGIIVREKTLYILKNYNNILLIIYS